jgi:hypothetical protein
VSARASRVFVRGAFLAFALGFSRPTHAAVLDRAAAETDVEAAMTDGHYAFCTSPSRPLSPLALRLCPLAEEIEGCDGMVKACAEATGGRKPRESAAWPEWLSKILRYLGLASIGLLAFGVIVALLVGLVRLARRAKEDEKLRDADSRAPAPRNVEPSASEVEAGGAEALLRKAQGYAVEGRFDLALFTYLGAALRALDERGAIRIARHRTHGEYVRSCGDAGARPLLREIVRDVDVVQFGGAGATPDIVAHAASHAVTIVRSAPVPSGVVARVVTMMVVILAFGACEGGLISPGRDPAGDDLLLDLLVREGAKARHLTGSLASLPMTGTEGPAVIVNTEKTALDDETKAHLVGWVEQGGVLVLAGSPDAWPSEFWAKEEPGTSRDVRVETPCPTDDDVCASPRVDHVRLAIPAAMSWPHEGPLSSSAQLESGELYAAVRPFDKGWVLGLASPELLTNAGLRVRGNASGLVALLESLDKSDFVVTKPENGVSPPSNPFSGLRRIGLGLALFHALAFAALLFLSVGTRHARPVPEPLARRRAFVEHVEATGALYARTHSAAHALAVYAHFADERLRAKAPRGTAPAAFLAQRSGADPKETAELYARAMSARVESPATGEELFVLRRLSALFSMAMRDGRSA